MRTSKGSGGLKGFEELDEIRLKKFLAADCPATFTLMSIVTEEGNGT